MNPKWIPKGSQGGPPGDPRMLRAGPPNLIKMHPQKDRDGAPGSEPVSRSIVKKSIPGGPQNRVENETPWRAKTAENKIPNGTPRRRPKWSQN